MRRRVRAVVIFMALIYSGAHFAASGVRQPLANFGGDFLAAFPSWRVASMAGRLDLYHGSLAEKWSGEDFWRRAGIARPVERPGQPFSAASIRRSAPLWHYGPLLHLLTVPLFACATLRSAYKVWLFVNYGFTILMMIIAVGILDRWRPALATTLAVIIAFCNFGPFYEAITQRTIEIFELLLIFAAYALMQHGRGVGAGLAIGTAAMAKFLPLIFLPYFVLRREWRALVGALAVIVPVAVITQPVLGWQNSGIVHQLIAGGFINHALDQSLAGFVRRIVTWTGVNLSIAVTSRIAILIATAAFSVLMVRSRRCDHAADLHWGLLIVAMVLLPPHNQQYYFVFLLFPYLLLFARYRAHPTRRTVLLAASFLLVAVPVPFTLLDRVTPNAFVSYLRLGFPFLGAAMLAFLLVFELRLISGGSDDGQHAGAVVSGS